MRAVGRIVEEWQIGQVQVRADPSCEMIVGSTWSDDGAYLSRGDPCGKAATVRVNYWPHWSVFWCPEHAATFTEPRWFYPGYFDRGPDDEPDVDEPTFIRQSVAA